MPSEFIVQRTNNANPPTFFLTIDYLLKHPSHHHLFTWPFVQRLERWFQWYDLTQRGSLPFSFRWRGRNASSIYELNPKTLTSGLDDYPRASHPSGSERHLDLRCWLALAASVIGKLYAIVKHQPANEYLQYAHDLMDNEQLDRLHWSEQDGMYADYGEHTEHVQLRRVSMVRIASQPAQTHVIRQVTQPEDIRATYVKHFGYVSLFPLMTRILNPESSKLKKILDDLRNSSLLWTSFGLRSLAKSSSLYGVRNTEHDPPYWRGTSMNVLV